MYEFAIRSAVERYDLSSTEGQLAALDAAAPIVARIRDRGLRQRYAVNLDRWLGLLDEQFVLRTSRRAFRGAAAGGRTGPTRGPVQPDLRNPAHQVEREVLKVAIQAPALAGPTFDALGRRRCSPQRRTPPSEKRWPPPAVPQPPLPARRG